MTIDNDLLEIIKAKRRQGLSSEQIWDELQGSYHPTVLSEHLLALQDMQTDNAVDSNQDLFRRRHHGMKFMLVGTICAGICALLSYLPFLGLGVVLVIWAFFTAIVIAIIGIIQCFANFRHTSYLSILVALVIVALGLSILIHNHLQHRAYQRREAYCYQKYPQSYKGDGRLADSPESDRIIKQSIYELTKRSECIHAKN